MTRKHPESDTENGRVLEAVIALADADDEDERAYHAAWERLRAAAKSWLDSTRAPAAQDPNGLLAAWHLQCPLSLGQLGQRLGVSPRRAGVYLVSLRRAGVPIRRVRFGADRDVRYCLGSPTEGTPVDAPLPGQRDLWTK